MVRFLVQSGFVGGWRAAVVGLKKVECVCCSTETLEELQKELASH